MVGTECILFQRINRKLLYKIWFSTACLSFVVCDTMLTDYSGVIESPNFPNPYPHNRNCTWVIKTSLGNTLNVSFSHFQVETHTSCAYDHLQVSAPESPMKSTLTYSLMKRSMQVKNPPCGFSHG